MSRRLLVRLSAGLLTGITAVTTLVSITAAPAGAATAVYGMDVSGWQGNVDWTSAYQRGARFAYVKATEGTAYQSPYFTQQYQGSYAVGMVRGAYHFGRPDVSAGATQADYFIAHGGGWSRDGRTLPGMLDIEWNPYGGTCYGIGPRRMVAWIKSFSDRYHLRTGRWPVIYTAESWWRRCTGNRGDFSTTNPLFVAQYPGNPATASAPAGYLPSGWDYYTIWQFADHGVFPGDQDRFNGSLLQLRRLALG